MRALVPLALLSAGAATGQATLLVGPGGFAQIRDAVAVASPGDIVLVQPGTYAQFNAQVACTIRAIVPGTVDVMVDTASLSCTGFSCFGAGVTVLAPPAGSRLHIAGLRFRPDSGNHNGTIVYAGVAVLRGTVTCEDCAFGVQGSSTLITALYVEHAAAHFSRCTVDSYPFASISHAMRVINADVTMVDTTVVSHLGTFGGFGLALDVQYSRLHGSGVSLQGLGGAALYCANASVWLSDSSLSNIMTSACAVAVGSGSPPQFDRVTVQSSASSCASYPPAAFLLGVDQPGPVVNGGAFALDFRSQPNGLVAVLATTELGPTTIPGVLAQPLWLDASTAYVAALLVADPLGSATTSIAIPAGAMFVDRTVWFQGVAGASLPLQLAPLAGGLVR